ncbi:phage head morphogenesis protein [Acinetobacter johnsonii]|uniref:phage head morphogenesis protein n=1 Tax=Acinetobacter johnsonii TaxID=40214 RepID=UPI00103C02CD|nr:phage minor head protein [Acinetobacter johnsonii]QBK70681.1 phage head morphogenesis protein [Acinetobacter johnsonii]
MAKTPQRPELNALFEMPPQDAIDYLKAKGFKIGWDWHETLDEAHSRAFTVAKVARIDLLQDIRKSLIDAMQQGQGFEQWKANITPTLQQKGWWGKQTVVNPAGMEQPVQLGSPRRLKTIFDTNMHKSLAAGRYKAMMAIVETRPIWVWVHISISNPRKIHLARNGEARRYDDPFWLYAYPPVGFGCQCKVIARRDSDIEDQNLNLIQTQPEDIEHHQVIIGKSSFTGQDVVSTQTRIRIKQQDGSESFLSPTPGFNSHPASSYLLDAELSKRAVDLVGVDKGTQQIQQVLLSRPRLKAHEAFIKNSLGDTPIQNKTSTVAVMHATDIQFMAAQKQAFENPIITLGDQLFLDKRSILSDAEWVDLPHLIAQSWRVLWDQENSQLLYWLQTVESHSENQVVQVAVQSKNGVMQIVDVAVVERSTVVDRLNSNTYLAVR